MTELVLVTHARLGEALRDLAHDILGDGASVVAVPVPADSDTGRAREQIERALARCVEVAPPLVLTDLPGATPHNLAVRAVAAICPGAPVVSGLSLPMLLRAMNHSHRSAGELAGIAVQGARRALEHSDGA